MQPIYQAVEGVVLDIPLDRLTNEITKPYSFYIGQRTVNEKTGEISFVNYREIQCVPLRDMDDPEAKPFTQDDDSNTNYLVWGYIDKYDGTQGLIIYGEGVTFNNVNFAFEITGPDYETYLKQIIESNNYDTLCLDGYYYSVNSSSIETRKTHYINRLQHDYYIMYPSFKSAKQLDIIVIDYDNSNINVDEIVYSPSKDTYSEGKNNDGIEYTYLGVPAQIYNGKASGSDVASGTYIGTGSHSFVLNFNSLPKLLMIYGPSIMAFAYTNTKAINILNATKENTSSFITQEINTDNASVSFIAPDLNTTGTTYSYVALY